MNLRTAELKYTRIRELRTLSINDTNGENYRNKCTTNNNMLVQTKKSVLKTNVTTFLPSGKIILIETK